MTKSWSDTQRNCSKCNNILFIEEFSTRMGLPIYSRCRKCRNVKATREPQPIEKPGRKKPPKALKKTKPEKVEVTERACIKCETIYSIEHFVSKKGKARYSKCPQCRQSDAREKRKKLLPLRPLRKKLLAQMGGKCQRCGYDEFTSSLCFHHRDPNEKEYQIGRLLDRYRYSPTEENHQNLLAEMEKCDILCANCHGAFHANEWQ